MKKLTFKHNGKTYEVYGKTQQADVCYQPHIFEIETASVPENQMQILKNFLLSKGIPKDDIRAKTTYELVYMAKRYLSSK